MLPAAHGDCLWLEWTGDGGVHRMLIDGGPYQTYPTLRERILHLPPHERRFELLVITHIDADHIEGVIRLLRDAEALGLQFERIWFNGMEQLKQVPDPAGDILGALQGEILSFLITGLEARANKRLLNAGLPKPYACVEAAPAALPVVELPGPLTLTLLSPDAQRLLDLKDNWEKELVDAGIAVGDVLAIQAALENDKRLRPMGDVLGANDDDLLEDRIEFPDPNDFDLADVLGGRKSPGSDTSKANGSSIAFLAEHEAATLLLTGDSFASVLFSSLGRLLSERGRTKLRVDGWKLAHHGSISNLTSELLALLDCRNYFISTSGAVFRHPDAPAIDLILERHAGGPKPALHFNYLTSTTQPWSAFASTPGDSYSAVYPRGITLAF